MRPIVTLLLISLSLLPLNAAVPMDAIHWSGTYTNPTAAGRLRKVQVYAFVDLQADSKLWWAVDKPLTQVLPLNDHRFHVGAIFSNGSQNPGSDRADEPVLRGNDDGLLRAFVGDAAGALVVVGADGRITRVERMTSGPRDTLKKVFAESADLTPLFIESQYPGAAVPVLRALRSGDFRAALATAKRVREGAPVLAALPERIGVLAAEEAAVLDDPAADPAARMFAAERLQAVIQEWPQLPEAKAIAASVKAARSDEAIAAERQAWAALDQYFAAARKAPAKKLQQVMKTQLAAIQAQHPDTHAAEVAAMIQKAARIE